MNTNLLFILFFLIFSCTEKQKKIAVLKNKNPLTKVDHIRKSKQVRQLIKSCENGDFVLRSGQGFISNMIRKTLNEKNNYTHCGIIIKTRDSSYIVHSIAKEIAGNDGVQTSSIYDFFSESTNDEVKIFRLNKTPQVREKISAKVLLLLKSKINFDYEFKLYDTTQMYCTELIYYAFDKSIRDKIFKLKEVKNNSFLLFSTFLDKNNFKIINF